MCDLYLFFICSFHFCCWRATRLLYFAKPEGFDDGHGQSVSISGTSTSCALANTAGFGGGTPNIAGLALEAAGFVTNPTESVDCFISMTALHHERGSHS
jgi:hypothetical protein